MRRTRRKLGLPGRSASRSEAAKRPFRFALGLSRSEPNPAVVARRPLDDVQRRGIPLQLRLGRMGPTILPQGRSTILDGPRRRRIRSRGGLGAHSEGRVSPDGVPPGVRSGLGAPRGRDLPRQSRGFDERAPRLSFCCYEQQKREFLGAALKVEEQPVTIYFFFMALSWVAVIPEARVVLDRRARRFLLLDLFSPIEARTDAVTIYLQFTISRRISPGPPSGLSSRPP